MTDDLDLTSSPPRPGRTAVSAIRPYFETLAMVGAATLAGLLVAPRWGNSPVDLLYLPAVLAAAALYGLAPGVLAAVGSALAYNYYFTQPLHSFRIDRIEDVATVALLFLVALVTSQLAARMRAAARDAKASAARNATIAGLARQLLSCSDVEQIARVACAELARLFDCNAVVMAGEPEPQLLAAKPALATLTPSDLAVAAWTIESGRPAGRGTPSVDATEWLFYPVKADKLVLAAVGLARDDGSRPVPPAQWALLDNLVDQVALAIERSRLEDEARSHDQLKERHQLRSTLLATIGQDVAPRLMAIDDAARALKRNGGDDRAPVSAITAEVAKLQQYLANLVGLGSDSDDPPVETGGVTIDLFHRSVTRDGAPIHLAPKEYAVLAELAKHKGRVLTHAHLLRAAWGPAQERQSDYLRVAVRALRQKLESDPANPQLIVNEPAVGYRLAIV